MFPCGNSLFAFGFPGLILLSGKRLDLDLDRGKQDWNMYEPKRRPS
jgi:hypothetical protein